MVILRAHRKEGIVESCAIFLVTLGSLSLCEKSAFY